MSVRRFIFYVKNIYEDKKLFFIIFFKHVDNFGVASNLMAKAMEESVPPLGWMSLTAYPISRS